MMFVNMANVTNDQVYSFILLVTGGLIMLTGVSIVVLVHRLLSPMHAEKVLLRTLQRFFQGCARIAIAYTMPGTRQVAAARNQRKRLFENRVLPLPTQLQGIMKSLDYRQFPANNENRVQDLVRNLYSLRNRLLTVEASYNTAASESPQLLQAILPLQGDWRRRVHDVFNKWARLEPADTLIEEWRRQPELSQDMQQHLETLQHNQEAATEARTTQNLYTLLGSLKGLLESMEKLQDSMNGINWAQWSAARF
jgi:hypothetical protein